jgi:hypothetical protein
VRNGSVILFPGDTVVVRLDSFGAPGQSVDLVRTGNAAGAGELPPDGLRLSFVQLPDGSMRLTVESDLAQNMAYAALISGAGRPAQRTSVCPVAARSVSREHWAAPIYGMVLTAFRAANSMQCDG